MRKSNKTQELAGWFVKEILGQELDYRFHRQHLKAAKELINPSGDAEPLDFEVVQICIKLLKEGQWGFDPSRLTSLYCVTWGTPPFYKQTIDKLKEVPPPYEVRSYDNWVLQYGRTARRIGVWDGVYRGWGSFEEIPFRLAPEAVTAAIA